MSLKETITAVFDNIIKNHGAKLVYGEPVEVKNKKIIPVAKISCKIGGCFAKNPHKTDNENYNSDNKLQDKGGAAFSAEPVGYIHVSEQEIKFVDINQKKRIAGTFLFGILFGIIYHKRRLKRKQKAVKDK